MPSPPLPPANLLGAPRTGVCHFVLLLLALLFGPSLHRSFPPMLMRRGCRCCGALHGGVQSLSDHGPRLPWSPAPAGPCLRTRPTVVGPLPAACAAACVEVVRAKPQLAPCNRHHRLARSSVNCGPHLPQSPAPQGPRLRTRPTVWWGPRPLLLQLPAAGVCAASQRRCVVIAATPPARSSDNCGPHLPQSPAPAGPPACGLAPLCGGAPSRCYRSPSPRGCALPAKDVAL